jgi:uncharacterized protein
MKEPTFGDGKICYLEIPAVDIKTSSEFFREVFNWNIRTHPDGTVSFDDAVGEVSGMWVTGKKPSPGDGLIVHIMVFDFNATVDKIEKKGGKIKELIPISETEKLAHFYDPAGNVFGIYHHQGDVPQA